MRTTTLLCIGMLTLASACKKYEDGPALSLLTKKSRLANEWRYDYVRAPNAQDITAQYADNKLEFTKDGTFILSDATSSETGTWQFASDKEDVVLTFASSGDAVTLHILRLKARELWFSVQESNGLSVFHMKPE
jgi:hypothetical protein